MKMQEKRGSPRARTSPIMVRVDGQSEHMYGFAGDISRSGIRLRMFSAALPFPISVGERVDLEFSLPNGGADIRCTGEVVWSGQPNRGSFAVTHQGVRFTDIETSSSEVIGWWVDNNRGPCDGI